MSLHKKEQDRIKTGDVVLFYQNSFPQAFLHVVNIAVEPTCVNGNGNTVTLTHLEIPMMIFNWLLNDDHLDSGEFYMKGIPCYLQVASRAGEIEENSVAKEIKPTAPSAPNTLF